MTSRLDRFYLKRLAAADRLGSMWRWAIFNCCFAAVGVGVYFYIPLVAQISGFIGFWITFRMLWKTVAIRTGVQRYRWAITLQEKPFSMRDAVSIVAYVCAFLSVLVAMRFMNVTTKPPFHLLWLIIALGNIGNFFWLVPKEDFWQDLSEKRRRVLSAEEMKILTRAGKTLGFAVSASVQQTARPTRIVTL